MEYIAKGTYPKPKVEAKNNYYASLLLQDYVGTVSEDTAIHLYFYQHMVKKEDQELAEILRNIAIVEMHHLELLGETIELLGVDPKYRTIGSDGTNLYFSTDYINYEKNIIRLLELDIKSEEQAIKNYETHKQMIQDIYIQNLLQRIIEDEKIHVKIFRQLLEQRKKR